MSVADDIDRKVKALVDLADQDVDQITRRKKIRLYGLGFLSKIRQIDYALYQIKELELVLDYTSDSTVEKPFKEIEKLSFYCDSYWTFLYSSLDIFGQFLNQCIQLGMDEEHVSFSQVHNTVKQNGGFPNIFTELENIKKSYSFTRLKKYRNCSNHRRDICLKRDVRLVEYSDAYTTSTDEIRQVEVYICDDAMDMNPKYKQKRLIPGFLQSSSDDIFDYINLILDKINL